MQVRTAILAASLAATSASKESASAGITAHSDLGRSLLSRARRLDDNGDDEMTWIADYSLKFQGCRQHTSVNLDGDEDDDGQRVVTTTQLAHFRLCPSDSCTSWRGGCNSDYGEYVVDLASFAQTYVEGQKKQQEYACQMYLYETCDCTESDDKDDNFNADYCEYDCFADSEQMQVCIDRNPYEEEEGDSQDEFQAQDYAECSEWEMPEEEEEEEAEEEADEEDGDDADRRRRRRRKLEEEEEVQYFIGPYCSADGSAVYLGLYTDDACTDFADADNGASTYKTLAGQDLPYSASSLVTAECVSCVEQEDPNDADEDDDAEDEVEISRECQEVYEAAGKCEQGLTGLTSDPDNAACSFISGVQMTDADGIVHSQASGWATFWIVGFAGAFAGLAGIVYRLRKQVARARTNPLLADGEDQALS